MDVMWINVNVMWILYISILKLGGGESTFPHSICGCKIDSPHFKIKNVAVMWRTAAVMWRNVDVMWRNVDVMWSNLDVNVDPPHLHISQLHQVLSPPR